MLFDQSTELGKPFNETNTAAIFGPTELSYRGTSLIRNISPLWDHHRTPGIVLLWGPKWALFFMLESRL